MKIQLMSNKAFENQRMLMDLNGTINYIKDRNMFVKNLEVGVYEIERVGVAMEEYEKKEFWKKVANVLASAYDVIIDENILSIYNKGEAPKDKLKASEEKKDNGDKGHKETADKPAKASAKSKVSPKSKKVQADK